MLRSSHPFALFDYFRVPYEITPRDTDTEELGVLDNAAARIHWPTGRAGGLCGLWFVDGSLFSATIASERQMRTWEHRLGGHWEDVAELRNPRDAAVSAVRRSSDGTLLLPFDPGDAMLSAWSEAYKGDPAGRRSRLKHSALTGYYALRPALPRSVQLALRRSFSRLQRRASFPRWPVETGLHDLYDLLFQWLAATLGRPLPGLAPWPDGKRWAIVLTHDVEHTAGYQSMAPIQSVERTLGYRSAWYLVPERDYVVDDNDVAELQAGGFEVGVHGLRHDGRDLSPEVLPDRLDAIQSWRDRWGSTGFRSPATHRDWEAMPTLGFTYDSSSFDTDPFEPQSGGCCTWLPFHNRGMVELPLTLTMDHTLFEILREDAGLWEVKADLLRDRGGMALLLTHPDYMQDDARLHSYASFLGRYANDATAWHALPDEVANWWNRRGESSVVEHEHGGHAVTGPAAAEAQVVLLGGSQT